MKRISEYIIPFGSYSNGVYEFEFELDDAFFELFPDSDIRKADIQAVVTMIRRERQLEFTFSLSGWVLLPCDRCLEEYEQPIEGTFNLYGKFGHGSNEDEFDVVWISHEASQVDLSQFLYEYVILSLPMRKVHPDRENGEPGCDPGMLDLLENLSV